MLLGTDPALEPIAAPPAPPAPPPPPMPVAKKKDNAQNSAEVESLKAIVAKLNERIANGDSIAEREYDQLKTEHTNNLSAFTKLVSASETKVKALEEEHNTHAALLSQETTFIQNKQKDLNRQLETLALQKAKFSQLAHEIDTTAKEVQAQLTIIAQKEQTILPRLKANVAKTEEALNKAKAELADLRKQREKLAALSQAVPARSKIKQAPLLSADIDFQTWIESQLLGGLYLAYLKKFIDKDQDEEVIARYQALTNPAARKILPTLSLVAILGIAAGVIRRADDKRYTDATPLRDTTIDNSRIWLLQALLEEFYTANPAFKPVHAAQFSADPSDMPTFIKAVLEALNKAVIGAQPKETPKAVPVVIEPTKPQLPAVTLRKAEVTSVAVPPKVQLPAFELKKAQAPNVVTKRALPAAHVQPALRRVEQVIATDCKIEVESLKDDSRSVLTASH